MESLHFKERGMEKKTKKTKREKTASKRAKSAPQSVYVQVFDGGRRYETGTSVKMGQRKPWRRPNPEEILSAIPGAVLSLLVKVGDEVTKDQELMMYEAMKMHSVVRAPFAGTVAQILVKEGDKIKKEALMMVIKAAGRTDEVGEVTPEFYFEDFG